MYSLPRHCFVCFAFTGHDHISFSFDPSMILNGQHSVNCFRYARVGMHFKINSVPAPSREAIR